MDIDRYSHLTSLIHAWDARFKILSLSLLIFLFAVANKPVSLMVIAITSVVLILLTKIPLIFVLKVLKGPFVLILFMTPILVLTWGGSAFFSIGFVHFYNDGLLASGQIAVKSFSIVLAFTALFGTSPLHITMKAAQFYKMPTALLSVFLFTYCYIFLFIEDVQKLLTAAKLRGHTLQRGIKNMKTSVNVLVNLLIRSFEQSESVQAAMHLRGFTGSFHSQTDFKCTWTDIAKGVIFLGIVSLLIWMEITG